MTAATYMKDKALDLFFGKQSYTVPDTLYAGLATNCTVAGVITGEPSTSAGYARVAVTNNDLATVWSGSTGGVKTNTNSAVQFPIVSSSGWGTLSTFFLADGSTGGNVLWYSTAMTPSITATAGMAPFVNPESLNITMT
jgi:hypothetical protein